MTDSHDLLMRLSEQARAEEIREIDVRDTVMQSIAAQPPCWRPERTSLAFCGVAVVLAACTVLAFLPSLQTMSQPWACYLP